MEINQPLDSELGVLELTPESRGYLEECAKWGKFLGIVGFIMAGFMVLVGVFAGTFFGAMMSDLEEINGGASWIGGGAMTFIYVLSSLLYFFPSLYVYRFATKTRKAIRTSNTTELTEGLKNLKSNYKFWGILTAVILGFYALIFVIGIFGGLFAAFSL